MKKFFYSFMALMMAMSMSMSFSSCSDDDDEGSGGSSSSGVKVSVDRGYINQTSSNRFEFFFTNFNLNTTSAPKGKCNVVIIGLATEEDYDGVPTGEFEGCFEVEVMKDYDFVNEEGFSYESGSRSETTGKLTIKKSGNKYTVSYSGVDLYEESDYDYYADEPAVKNTSFTYTGKLEEFPNRDDDYDYYY